MYSIAITIVAVIFIVMYLIVRSHNLDLNVEMIRKLSVKDAEMRAFEKKCDDGVVEIVESYEADRLDMQEKIEMLENTLLVVSSEITDRDQIIDHHATHCHGLVEDTIEMHLERLRPTHKDEEPEGVAADG